jgi:hypothetical protein
MKKLVIGLMAIVSVYAFAFHPGDKERLIDIGTGTKLKVLKDVNIIPNKVKIALGDRCFLHVNEAKDFDRVLAEDSVLTVIRTTGTYRDADVLIVDNKNINSIYCLNRDGKRPSIGDFKEDTKEALEVKLADPTRI